MHRGSRIQRDNVTLRTGSIERGPELAQDVDAVAAELIELFDTGDDGTRARLGGQQSLSCGEYEQARDSNAIARQSSHGADGVLDQGYLDDDLIGEARELTSILIHVLAVDRVDRDVHRSVHNAADLGKLLSLVSLLLAKERRRGHHTIEKSIPRRPGDVIEIDACEQNLHESPR